MSLAAALTGDADYIVIKDRHPLRLKELQDIPIVSLQQALQLFRSCS